MKEKFRDIRLSADNKLKLDLINKIVREYQKQGLVLTLRQLYYQLVSRDVIPNEQKEYAKLSKLLKEGRMAGIVDWSAIEDRLRTAEKPSAWDTPADIMKSVIRQYAKPRMKGQANYLEVWVEKDALSGVLSRVTEEYHVPILVNRGYSSASAIYDSYGRFRTALTAGQEVVIIYLGDHDPSGSDMIRDVYDRPLEMLLPMADDFIDDVYEKWVKEKFDGDYREANDDLESEYYEHKDCFDVEDDGDGKYETFNPRKAFVKSRFKVIPVALTMSQIRAYNPPPNPAKITDPRAKEYIKKHGAKSWEVDALRPEVLNDLLRDAIVSRIDLDLYNQVLEEEQADIKNLEDLTAKL